MAAVLVVYAALVATHEGEFWPFSIYPMFSQADKPWVRTVVYELDASELARLQWRPQPLSELPGVPFAAAEHGIEVIDLAKYVSMTERWDEPRILGLQKMLGDSAERRLVVFRVAGWLEGEGGGRRVGITYEPVVALGGGRGPHRTAESQGGTGRWHAAR